MNYARGRGRRATGVRISNVIRAAVAGAVTPPGEIYAPVGGRVVVSTVVVIVAVF